MAFVLEINQEDDFAEIISRLRATGTERELVLRVAKDALLFSELINLVELKKRTDAAGKLILLETADKAGAELARKAGYDVYLLVPEPFVEPVITSQAQPRTIHRVNRTLATVFSLAMIILLLLAFVILPEADITVYAKTEVLSRDMQITVDSTATSIDSQQLVLPGTKLSNPQQYSQVFQSTGNSAVGQKATGTIQIYNFTGHVLKLGASTTTLTVGSATYHFVSDASNIPATRYFANSTTTVDPSSLGAPVAIIADQAGDAYNLPQNTRIEIKNAVFGSNPQQLYAASATSIAGGISTSQQNSNPIITPSDQADANTALQKQLLAATEQQLLTSKGLTLLDSGANLVNPNINFDHKINDATSSFKGTITGTISGLAFSKLDLVKLVEQRIALSLDPGMYLVTDISSGNAETITESFRSYSSGSGSGVLMVHVDGIIASNVDTSTFTQQFKGKSVAQIQSILAQNPTVQGANIILKPFWVRSAPRFLNKIYITTKVQKLQSQDQTTQIP